MTRRLTFSILACILTANLAVPAYGQPVASDSDPAGNLEVVDYEDDYQLANASTERINGKRTKLGCEFPLPELSLAQGQTALEARVISTDLSTCVQEIEVGEPPPEALEHEGRDGVSVVVPFDEWGSKSPSPGDVTSSSRQQLAAADNAAAAATTATAYYEVRWHDFLHLTTHYTRAYTTWTWNGSCVTSSSNWGYYWWLQLTSWTKVASSGFYSQICNNVKSTVDWAHYRNYLFCLHPSFGYTIVNSYVDDAWVRGYYNGSVNGGVVSTWSVESGVLPQLCPNLHYHVILVKT